MNIVNSLSSRFAVCSINAREFLVRTIAISKLLSNASARMLMNVRVFPLCTLPSSIPGLSDVVAVIRSSATVSSAQRKVSALKDELAALYVGQYGPEIDRDWHYMLDWMLSCFTRCTC